MTLWTAAPEGTVAVHEATAAVIGSPHATLGLGGLAAPGELTGDGLADLVVGGCDSRPLPGPSGLHRCDGAAWVLAGPLSGTRSLEDVAVWVAHPEAASDQAGWAVAGFASVGWNGEPGVAMGAIAADPGGNASGAAYLFLGPFSGGAADPGDAILRIDGIDKDDELGSALANAGDLDGDGVEELAVGAPQAYDGQGAVGIFAGVSEGVVTIEDADILVVGRGSGSASGSRAGQALGGGADIDGDGLDELLVGATGWDEGRGLAVAVDGAGAGGVVDLEDIEQRVEGVTPDTDLGWRVAAPGDVDGDGHADLLVGAAGPEARAAAGVTTYGEAFLWYGPLTAPLSTSEADVDFVNDPADPAWSTQFFVVGLAGIGDMDGNGSDDLAIGGISYLVGDHDHGRPFGSLHVWYGGNETPP